MSPDDRTESEKYLEEINQALKERIVHLEHELQALKEQLRTQEVQSLPNGMGAC